MPRTVNYQIHLHGDELRIEAHNGPTAAHVSLVSGQDGRVTISGPIDRVHDLIDTLATAVASLYETSGYEVRLAWPDGRALAEHERQRLAWLTYLEERGARQSAKRDDVGVPTATTYVDGDA